MKDLDFIIEVQDILSGEMDCIIGGSHDETNPCSPGGHIDCYKDGTKHELELLSVI
ncbi:hypothetical protein [Proteiniphilum sp.]|uniref:hypothetical protein n=1 Tax=Proteiniphilum sp. TaxID=1926877 RepID=UPI00332189C4